MTALSSLQIKKARVTECHQSPCEPGSMLRRKATGDSQTTSLDDFILGVVGVRIATGEASKGRLLSQIAEEICGLTAETINSNCHWTSGGDHSPTQFIPSSSVHLFYIASCTPWQPPVLFPAPARASANL